MLAASVAGAALISTQWGPLRPKLLTTSQESSFCAWPLLHAGLNSKKMHILLPICSGIVRYLLHLHPASPQRGAGHLSPHALRTHQASKPEARTWQRPPTRGLLRRRCRKSVARLLEGTGRDRARREGPRSPRAAPCPAAVSPAPKMAAGPRTCPASGRPGRRAAGSGGGPCAWSAPPRSRAPAAAGPVGGAGGSGRSRARFYLAEGPRGGAGAGSAAEPADGRGRAAAVTPPGAAAGPAAGS